MDTHILPLSCFNTLAYFLFTWYLLLTIYMVTYIHPVFCLNVLEPHIVAFGERSSVPPILQPSHALAGTLLSILHVVCKSDTSGYLPLTTLLFILSVKVTTVNTLMPPPCSMTQHLTPRLRHSCIKLLNESALDTMLSAGAAPSAIWHHGRA